MRSVQAVALDAFAPLFFLLIDLTCARLSEALTHRFLASPAVIEIASPLRCGSTRGYDQVGASRPRSTTLLATFSTVSGKRPSQFSALSGVVSELPLP